MAEQASARAVNQPSTILVVEDDPPIQALLRDMLISAGYNTIVVDSGYAALDTIDHDSIDLLLLDVMLPDIDGHEVARRIREHHLTDLPVIMLTAMTEAQSVIDGLQTADDYVSKPFIPDELLLRIRSHLSKRQRIVTGTQQNEALSDMLQLVQRQLQAAHQETQTESLMRQELLHNVMTHLQSLCAIVDAELRKLPPGPEREAVQRIRARVRGATLVYQVSEALRAETAPIGEIIRMTASALKSIYRPWKRITMTVKGEPAQLPTRIAAPLAMVVNELITNSFKHAFPENRFGAITVEYALSGDEFRLEVEDDGVGLPARSTDGNGRATVRQIIENLNGSVAWHSTGDGTRVSLRLPVPAAQTAAPAPAP